MKHTERSKPRGFLRWFLRAPIALYRIGLGGLLGHRFLCLTHTGRVSGQPRRTVIEVLSRDKEAGVYYVVSGWGEKADWLRNVQKEPRCRVQVGWSSYDARAKRLEGAEAERVFMDYAAKHPAALRQLVKVMGFEVDGSDEQYRQVAHALPIVGFFPAS